MNFKKVIPILAVALLVCSAILLKASPASASDNVTVNVTVEQNVVVEQVAALPAPPAPPAPAPWAPPAPPAPAPWAPPAPIIPFPHPAPPAPVIYPPAPAPAPAPVRCPRPYYPYIGIYNPCISCDPCARPMYESYIVVSELAQPITQVQAEPQTQIDPPPIINSFTIDPAYIQPGGTAVLTWTVSDVLQRDFTVTISPTVGSVSGSGSFNVSPVTTTTYTLTATNVDGSVSANATVTVAPVVAAATYTTGAETTGGSDSGLAGNPWLPYILLLGLLAAAATAIVVLITRKPRMACATVQTGYKTTAGKGTETSIPCTKPAAGAKLITADGEYVPVPGDDRTLGRDDFRSILKPAKAELISRKHLRVEHKNNEYYIEDSGSTNGTRINGSTITGKGRHLLKNDDLIDLGGVLNLIFKT